MALAVCGWFAPAYGEDNDVVIVAPPPVSSSTEVSPNAQAITGEIKKIDTVKDAAGVKHRVVHLEVADDIRYQIHLGPKDSLEDLDLDKGDTITVHVVPGRFNGQYMFDAYRIRDDDGRVVQLAPPPARTVVPGQSEVIRIERPRTAYSVPATPAPEAAVPATPSPGLTPTTSMHSVQGQILDTWTASVPNYGDVQMARVRTQDGAVVPVDLGLRRSLPEGFSLVPGSWVRVSGQWTQSGDQQVLVADSLTRSQRIVR
jgi:hypothetical protein